AQFELDRDRLGKDAGKDTEPDALDGVDFGYSPHAPYSTSMELYQHAFGRAFGEGRICTTHVGESPEEEALVRDGGGPLPNLLKNFGIDLSSFKGFGTTPISLLLGEWLMP